MTTETHAEMTTITELTIDEPFVKLLYSKLFKLDFTESLISYFINIPCKLCKGDYYLYLEWKFNDEYYNLPSNYLKGFDEIMRWYRGCIYGSWDNFASIMKRRKVELIVQITSVISNYLFYTVMLKVGNSEHKLGDSKIKMSDLPKDSLIEVSQLKKNNLGLVKGYIVKDFKRDTNTSLIVFSLDDSLAAFFNTYIMEVNNKLYCVIDNNLTKCDSIYIRTSKTDNKTTVIIKIDDDLYYEYVSDYKPLPDVNTKDKVILAFGYYNIVETNSDDLVLAFDMINNEYYDITNCATNKTLLKYIDFNDSYGKHALKDNIILQIVYKDNKCYSRLFKLKDNSLIDRLTRTFNQFDDSIPLYSSIVHNINTIKDIIDYKSNDEDEVATIDLDDMELNDI